MKNRTIAQLKKALTKVFNKFIRLRDRELPCISCGGYCNDGQAGHFIPSTYSAVRFNENNVNKQCAGCNLWKHGNLIEYRPNLIKKIGLEAVKELESKRHNLIKWDRGWLEGKIAYYKEQIALTEDT